MASVVANYISKWLDRFKSDKYPKKKALRVAALRAFALCVKCSQAITFVFNYIIHTYRSFVKRP